MSLCASKFLMHRKHDVAESFTDPACEFSGDLNDKYRLLILSKRYFTLQITYRHLIAKSGTLWGGQDFGTISGLNGQFVVF